MAKIADILTKLIEKSRDGKITWSATASKQKFLTMLGDTGIAIDFDASTKVYELDVIDARGRVIESVSGNYMPARPGGILPETPTAETLKELHGIARRSALDVDSTLDELVSRLDSIV